MKKFAHPVWMLPFVMLTGALGFVLRTWLVATGVDHKGLLVDGHIAGTLSLILTGITLGLLFLWLRQPLKKCSQKNRFPASLPAAIGCWVAAAGVLFTELPQLQDGADRLALVSVAIATIAAIALGILGFFRLKGLPAHVNLIPLNHVEESPLKPSSKAAVAAFQKILEDGGVTATVRRTLGGDIDASCGQLRRKYTKEQKPTH